MRILISNSSPDPIYKQIVDQIRMNIVKDELNPGDSLPSIRKLAKDLHVSVITTKRAYEELEKEGLIETVPGKGSFISRQDRERLKEKNLVIIEEKLKDLVKESKLMGFKYEDIDEILKILFEEE